MAKNTIQMGEETWERMDRAAETLSEEARAEGRETWSRNALVEHCCVRWLEEWEAERRGKKPGR